MDHDKLIEESANIFGRSLEAPSTKDPDIQEGVMSWLGSKATALGKRSGARKARKLALKAAKEKRTATAQRASGLRKSWQSKTGDSNLSIDNRAAQIEHDAQVANPPEGGHDIKTGGAAGQASRNIAARDEKAVDYMRKTGNAGQAERDADAAEDEAEMAKYKKKRQAGYTNKK